MSQTTGILDYLRAKWRDNPENPWIFSYDLIKVHTPYGYFGIEAKRRCEEMVKSGILKSTKDGKYVKFAYNPDYFLQPIREEKKSEGFVPLFQ